MFVFRAKKTNFLGVSQKKTFSRKKKKKTYFMSELVNTPSPAKRRCISPLFTPPPLPSHPVSFSLLLTQTPTDLLCMIIQYLDIHQHCLTSYTCHRLYQVVRTVPSSLVLSSLRAVHSYSLFALANYQPHVASLVGVTRKSELDCFARVDKLEFDFGTWIRTPADISDSIRSVSEKRVQRLRLKVTDRTSDYFWEWIKRYRYSSSPIIDSIEILFYKENEMTKINAWLMHLPSTLTTFTARFRVVCACGVWQDMCACSSCEPFEISDEAWSYLCSLPLQRLYITGESWGGWSAARLGSLASIHSLTDLTIDGLSMPTEWPITTALPPLPFVRHLTLYNVSLWSTDAWKLCARFTPAVNELHVKRYTSSSFFLLFSLWSFLSTLTIDLALYTPPEGSSPLSFTSSSSPFVSSLTSSVLASSSSSSSSSSNLISNTSSLKSLTLNLTPAALDYFPKIVPHLPSRLIDLSICGTSTDKTKSYPTLFSPLFSDDTCPFHHLHLLHVSFPIHDHKEFVEFAKKKKWKLR